MVRLVIVLFTNMKKKYPAKFVTISFYDLIWQELLANKFGHSRSKDTRDKVLNCKRDNIKD